MSGTRTERSEHSEACGKREAFHAFLQWMRVIFLTRRVDNLPETRKASIRKQGRRERNLDAMASIAQRYGEKKFARSFSAKDRRHAFRWRPPSEERLELFECLENENGLPDRATAPVVASCKGPAQRNPTSIGASRRCIAAPAAAVGF